MRIGVDLGGTKIEALALDEGGTERFRRRIATPRHAYAATIDAIAGLVRAAWREVGAATVGIGIPGAESRATGLIKNANSTWLNGRPLRDDLRAALGCEVRIANDANCFALSEAVDGAGAPYPVVFGVILGTGTGGGIVIDRRVLVGPNAIAGEWGHNALPWPNDDERPGPACYCGQSGCIETFLSGPGLARDYRETTGLESTAAEIARLSTSGDPPAVAALARYAGRLARALASVINVLDPDAIVLGGGLSQIASLYDEVPRLWGTHVFSDVLTTRLLRARHGDASGVRGAAWLW